MERVKIGYDNSNIFKHLIFAWILPLFKYFKITPPTLQNIPQVPSQFQYTQKYTQLLAHWQSQLNKSNPSFFRALFKTIGWRFIKYSYMFGGRFLNTFFQAILISWIISYLRDDDRPFYEGIFFILAVIIPTLIVLLMNAYAGVNLCVIITESKNWICMIISQKIQKVSSLTLNKGDRIGNILNVIGNDIQLLDMLYSVFVIFVIPIHTIGGMIALYFYLGYAGFLGYLIVFFNVFIVIRMSRVNLKFRKQVVRFSDPRIKMINNLIEGVKLVKLYGWEDPFVKQVCEQRLYEIKGVKKLGWVQIFIRTINYGLDGLAILLPIYVSVQTGHQVSVQNALSAFTILVMSSRYMASVLNVALRSLYMFNSACQRVTNILLLEQSEILETPYIQNPKIKAQDWSCTWDQKDPLKFSLNNLNFKLRKRQILLVTGPVGCGKTSFLTGILNQLHTKSGKISVKGSISYCPQTPWIISASIKENIVLGQEFDQKKYLKCLKAAALKYDLGLMVAGDQTVVGDRGVMLSGGQKTRICLARAFYADRNILLLDDPLSAVDAQVSSILFKNIKKQASKGKIVILASHQIQYMNLVNKLLVLQQGEIYYFGHPEQFQHKDQLEIYQKEKQEKRQEKQQVGKTQLIQQEEVSTGSIGVKIYWKFFMLGFKSTLFFIFSVLIFALSQVCLLSVYLWIVEWTTSNQQQNHYYFYISLLILLGLYSTGFFRFLILIFCLINSSKNLHNKALKGVTYTNSTFFDKNPTGRVINRFSKDTAIVDQPLLYFFLDAIHYTLQVTGSLILITIISPINIIGLFLFGLVFYIIMKKLIWLSKALRRLELVSRSPLFTCINSIILGLVSIRCLKVSQKFVQDGRQTAADNMRASIAYQMFLRYMQLLIDCGSFVVGTVNIITLISIKGLIDPDSAALSLSLTTTLLGMCSLWVKCLAQTDNYMSSVQRLFSYSALPEQGKFQQKTGFSITEGKIEFCEVSMKYQNHLPFSLQEFSCTIPAGSKVGVVGRTGAGKSSILQVLFRLVNPCSGRVLIDQQDYIFAGLHQLRLQMSVIPQSPFIFKSSLRQNIDPFMNYTDQQIWIVLEEIRMLQFVQELPEGIKTQISPDELNLSAGQKQLICLARVILRKNKIVVMDEATANIDQQTDKFIQKTIKKVFTKSTLIIIAHRLRTIISSDIVIVMGEGTCQQKGPPEQLASDPNTHFSKLIKHTTKSEKDYLHKKLKKTY